LSAPVPKVARYIIVGDDRDGTTQHRHNYLPADEFPVAFIIRMDCHRRISQDGFRAGGGDWNKFVCGSGQHILEIIESAGFLGIFHFQIRDGRLSPGDQLIRRGPR